MVFNRDDKKLPHKTHAKVRVPTVSFGVVLGEIIKNFLVRLSPAADFAIFCLLPVSCFDKNYFFLFGNFCYS